jgi:hypothetical protein
MAKQRYGEMQIGMSSQLGRQIGNANAREYHPARANYSNSAIPLKFRTKPPEHSP